MVDGQLPMRVKNGPDGPEKPFPNDPNKRTSSGPVGMSQTCTTRDSCTAPARATNAAGISRPRAIETANVKPHLTLRAKKAFISADIEMNRCSYPDPALRIRGAIHAELTARLLVLGHFLGKQRQ
jgi:hypothetical protein